MTGLDLISGSLRLIGALASGESLQASEATDGLSSLNDMLDSWSTEDLMIPNKSREVFPLVVGQQAYTIGPAGNFNTTRPTWIETILIQITSSSPTIELPVKLLTEAEFSTILVKQLQSTIPTYAYAEGTSPLETINLWPVPQAANNIVIYSAKALTNIALNTSIAVPIGYIRALRFNLAIELAAEYGKAVPEHVLEIAMKSKATLKRVNWNPTYLEVDDAIRARSAVWNWRTGGVT